MEPAQLPTSVMLTVYLASTNPGKLREFRGAAESRGIEVELLPGIENRPVCVEDGNTFEENACKKALYYSQWNDGMIFADDSGISVDALGSGPGVYSARFAGPQADDEANNRKLLRELAGVPPSGRTAHYVCVIALARRGAILTVVDGRADGLITEGPIGTGGFGYDPYFYYPPLNKTFAELRIEEKFEISHRGKAFRKLLEYVQALCPDS
ncbi:MAG TPA: RdgB/HAM1 family non-canonical purine NTP pyrophosphatase [Terriglobia bacterium]|nr:RdgB/HAM1 family non-canonical purine NTP pyrophosphatase [Terriglobia bacterium]